MSRHDAYRTTYHRDRSVTIWDCHAQSWMRKARGRDLSGRLLGTLMPWERAKVLRHVYGPVSKADIRGLRAEAATRVNAMRGCVRPEGRALAWSWEESEAAARAAAAELEAELGCRAVIERPEDA